MNNITIVVEGCDGASKSTTIKGLSENWFSDRKVKSVFDPGISSEKEFERWQDIRNFVKYQKMHPTSELLMFYAMRSELSNYMQQLNDAGYDVVSDRYNISSLIYQGMLKGQLDLIENLEDIFKFKQPNLTIILYADFDILTERLLKRASNIDKFKNNTDFRKKVYDAYIDIINSTKGIDNIVSINTSKLSPEEVFEKSKNIIEKFL